MSPETSRQATDTQTVAVRTHSLLWQPQSTASNRHPDRKGNMAHRRMPICHHLPIKTNIRCLRRLRVSSSMASHLNKATMPHMTTSDMASLLVEVDLMLAGSDAEHPWISSSTRQNVAETDARYA